MKQSKIDSLLSVEKVIVTSNRVKIKSQNRQRRLMLEAHSIDGLEKFQLFFRQNEMFHDKFSVGLKYFDYDGTEIILVRFNGSHSHKNKCINNNSFEGFHKHYATEIAINLGIKPECFAEKAHYTSFETAVEYFFFEVNVKNFSEYLKIFNIGTRDAGQTEMFE